MKKVLILLIIILIGSLSVNTIALAETSNNDISDKVDSELDKIDFDDLDKFINDNIDNKEVFGTTIRNYIKGIIKGEFKIGFSDIVSVTSKLLFGDIMSFLPVVIMVLSIGVMFSIIDGISGKFTAKGTSEIIYFVCYITIIVIILSSVGMLLSDAIKVIFKMHELMRIIFPILLTLMASLGGVVSVSAYQPLMAALAFIVSGIVTKLIIPLFLATLIFSIVGGLSANIKLDKMTDSLKSVGEYALGFVFSIFTSFVLVKGITGSAIDNVSIKSAKFAISSYVPILGGYLSDGFDLALASIVLIKNALGFVGVATVLVLTLAPVIKIAIFILTLRITAGIIEPICDVRISNFIYSISKNMTLLIAIILGIAFMFFIMCMLVILSLNAVV